MVPKVLKALWGILESRVFKVLLDLRALLDIKVLKALKALKVFKVFKVPKV